MTPEQIVWDQRVPVAPYRGDRTKRYGCRQEHSGSCRYLVFRHGNSITAKCRRRNVELESLP